ncbi:MAG TPA: hypothetical protein DD379_21495 [Cyanobacteria bacterium UBA11162]|nr:hypothetical protein [Cyanobacteria bacterium UBA11162]
MRCDEDNWLDNWQSIVIALVLNGTFILLGALAVIGLPIAVLEDMGSLLLVTLNAMRLCNTKVENYPHDFETFCQHIMPIISEAIERGLFNNWYDVTDAIAENIKPSNPKNRRSPAVRTKLRVKGLITRYEPKEVLDLVCLVLGRCDR